MLPKDIGSLGKIMVSIQEMGQRLTPIELVKMIMCAPIARKPNIIRTGASSSMASLLTSPKHMQCKILMQGVDLYRILKTFLLLRISRR